MTETKRYELKFENGNHYVKAYEAIADKEIKVIGINKHGLAISHGTISKKTSKELLDNGTEIRIDGENRNFIVSYEEYVRLTSEYRKEKDEYIVENNLI